MHWYDKLSPEKKEEIAKQYQKNETVKDHTLTVSFDILDADRKTLIGSRVSNAVSVTLTKNEADRFSLPTALELIEAVARHLSLSNIRRGWVTDQLRDLPSEAKGKAYLLYNVDNDLESSRHCLEGVETKKIAYPNTPVSLRTPRDIEVAESFYKNRYAEYETQ